MSDLTFSTAYSIIYASTVAGFLFGLWNWKEVMEIEPDDTKNEGSHKEVLVPKVNEKGETPNQVMNIIAKNIQNGAITFLKQEFTYLSVFLAIFGLIILLTDNFKFYTTVAFLVGALTSIISGFIGMYIATRANVRVTYQADKYLADQGNSLRQGFIVAFKGGCVMGFCLVSLALAILTTLIIVYIAILKPSTTEEYKTMFEFLAGYGLGGSTVALFCRVGGGIYTKAADVGADLVGKNELGLDEDSADNPATIADNVGDNVGDIAGMGSDLFGSFAESTCAALVVSGTSVGLTQGANFLWPLLLSAAGILVCILTSFFATHIQAVDRIDKIENTLKWQLIISTLLLTPTIIVLSIYGLPASFTFVSGDANSLVLESHNWSIMACALVGLYAGLTIGFFTDYYTSNAHEPTQYLAESCKSGAAINIIQGLALGYLSCIIPILSIGVAVFVSFKFAGMYGIAIAALGMLNNLAISLAIDAYGPISDNAGGIAEMSNVPKSVRTNTDALDAAGNTTAAIGKGFAIGSACLVSLSLFGAFVTRTKMTNVNLLEPIQISCLLVGAMMPYAFSALTMKSVGTAAQKMCLEIKSQVTQGKNDPEKCIEISTEASLKEMILPGVMVIFTPLVLGGLFGPKAVAGYLAGVIVSGVQLAIASSNAGGAWDNAKKYIEAKNLECLDSEYSKLEKEARESGGKVEHVEVINNKRYYTKKSEPHKAAVTGDTVGDPLKDTSGPSLNILIKLSAIVSLIFGSFFADNAIWKF